jgi:DNA replication protein DnaC
MTPLESAWKELKFTSDPSSLSEEESRLLLRVLEEEIHVRKNKRIQYLMGRSGIRRIKRIEDFDWKFNPSLPREAFMKFRSSGWADEGRNLVLVGPTGVGSAMMPSCLGFLPPESPVMSW